jgi:hypothetical protein
MAKKQKRYVPRSADGTTPVRSESSPSRVVTSSEFNPDYTPIIKDLKQIGILAVTFIGILVVLSFFLR